MTARIKRAGNNYAVQASAGASWVTIAYTAHIDMAYVLLYGRNRWDVVGVDLLPRTATVDGLLIRVIDCGGRA